MSPAPSSRITNAPMMIFFFFTEILLDRSGPDCPIIPRSGPISPPFSRCRLPAPGLRDADRHGSLDEQVHELDGKPVIVTPIFGGLEKKPQEMDVRKERPEECLCRGVGVEITEDPP